MLTLIAQGTQVVDIAAGAGSISKISSLGRLVEMGAAAILIVGGLAFLVYLLMGGLNWITAGGDKGKVEHAREMITQGIIGIAILASVFALYGVVLRFLGVDSILLGQSEGPKTSTSTSGGSNSTGNDICKVGSQVSDGGSGGYCTGGGAARVICVAAGQGPSKLGYVHYEPVCCLSGNKVSGYTFQGQDKCN